MSEDYPPKIDFSKPVSGGREFTCFDEGYKKAIDELVNRNFAFQSELTREQLHEALRQALISGDFIRLVHFGTGDQTVLYEPYRLEQSLNNRIRALRSALEQIVDLSQTTGLSFEDQSFRATQIAQEALNDPAHIL